MTQWLEQARVTFKFSLPGKAMEIRRTLVDIPSFLNVSWNTRVARDIDNNCLLI